MTKGKIAVLVFGGIVIIVLLVVLIVFPAPQEKNTGTDVATTTATSTKTIDVGDGVSLEVPEGITIEKVPASEGTSIERPSLDRPVTIPDYFPEDAAKNAATKIAEAIALIEEDPTSFDHWLQLAVLRYQIEDYEGAIEIYDYLNIVNPENDVAFMNLGNLYHLQLRDFEKAEKNLRQAITNNSTNVLAYTSLYELYRDSYKTDTDLAEQTLLEGLSVMPDELNLLLALGDYYKRQDRIKEAIDVLKRAEAKADSTGDTATRDRVAAEINELESN